ILVLATGFLGASSLLQLLHLLSEASGQVTAEILLRSMQLAVLGALWIWGVRVPLLGRSGTPQAEGQARFWRSFGLVFLLLTVYYTADFLVIRISQPTGSASFAGSSLATQAQYLPLLLAIVVYWGSTDFIEWGETAAINVAAVVRRLGSHRAVFV